MNTFQTQLQEEFIEKSNHLNALNYNRINAIREFIIWAESKIEELHLWLKQYEFDDEQEEIYFFKEIKPTIISKLILQKEILSIESNAPASRILLKKYYQEELEKIAINSKKNARFYQYYRSRSTDLDVIYYTRTSKKDILETGSYRINADLRISTCYDYKIANIKAYDELAIYIEKQIKRIKKSANTDTIPFSKLNWSGSKVELIELIYALHFKKTINDGNIEIKEIANVIGMLFNIDISENLYRYYVDIKNRKNPTSKFILALANTFQKKLEEDNL